jgi:uncharacterized membrane protein
MENQKINPIKQRNWLILILRWLIGGAVAYKVSLFLFILSETQYPPVLGPIISGQQGLFYKLTFNFLYSHLNSSDLIFEISIFLYQFIWVTTSALIASGEKIQMRIGVILLIIYILLGIGFSMFSIIWFVST